MSTTTRRAQLDHLLDDILEAYSDKDHPIRLIATAHGAVFDLNSMTLQDSSNAPVSITNAIKNRILCLPDFYIHYVDKSTNDWTTLTATDFDTFMLTGTGPYTSTPTATAPTSGGTSTTTIDSASLAAIAAAIGTATTSAVTSAPRHTPDPVETFLKNKGNVEDYKPLREAKFWNVWHRAFIATAHAQGLENMVNPTFVPPTVGAVGYDVWQAKQKHAFAILSSTLLESGSQQIVHRYSDQSDPTTFGDAQSIYRDLVLHFTGGVAAATTLESLEREIDLLCWDRKWSKTHVAFLMMVDHKLVDHRGLAPSANFPDTWYIKKLNATFKNHNEVTSYIGQLALQEVTYTRVSGAAVTAALTYEIQVSHLRDFCIMLDARHQEQAAANQASTAMKTEIKKSLGIHTSEGEQQTGHRRGGPGHGRGCGRGRGRGRGRSQGRGRGRERGRYHNFLSDDEFWSLDEEGYQRLLQERATRGELSLNNTDTQPQSTSVQPTNANVGPTTPQPVPSTVSATTPVDAASQVSAPSRQANMLQISPHSAAVTPSPPGPTSSHMDSGPSTLLRQMMSTASARSQPRPVTLVLL